LKCSSIEARRDRPNRTVPPENPNQSRPRAALADGQRISPSKESRTAQIWNPETQENSYPQPAFFCSHQGGNAQRATDCSLISLHRRCGRPFSTSGMCGSDCYVRCCPGTDYDAERRCSHSGTVNSPHFHHDQLHDVLQFPRGELSRGLLRSPRLLMRRGHP
jgi:hypothetical protein